MTTTTRTGNVFSPDQFVPTKFSSAEDKAKAANRLVRFIERGFPATAWNKPLYNSLYLHLFGHIAHYDAAGFWAEWFSTPERQARWLEYAVESPRYGDPAFTWVDVETAVAEWIEQRGLVT